MSAKNIILLGAVIIITEVASAADCTLLSSSGSPLPYTATTTWGGATGSIRDKDALEERVTQLNSFYTATFHCPDATAVYLELIVETTSAPNFASVSDNLDLIAGDTTGVTHLVDVRVNGTQIVTDTPANRAPPTTVIYPFTNGDSLPLDSNNNLNVIVTSTYSLTGGAEELAAGDYEAEFNLLVTPIPAGISAPNTTTIRGTVSPECSVDTQTRYSQTGTAVPYVVLERGAFNSRVRKMQAFDSVTFDCNSNSFSYSVDLTALTAPNFTNAENIDLVDAPTEIGVDHKVGVGMKFPVGPFPDENITTKSVLAPGTVAMAPAFNKLDLNGDVEIEVASRFEVINNAEELAAGQYNAQFSITITAN